MAPRTIKGGVSLAPELCANHSGLLSKVEGIEKDLDNHIGRDHKAQDDRMDKMDKKIDRLPNWATFVIAFLSSIATYGLTH